MLMSRKQFNLGMTAALAGIATTGAAGAEQTPAALAGGAKRMGYFYKNATFEFIFQIALGRAYYCGGNPGKILWLTRQIADGDYEGAYQALRAAGDEARTIAEDSGAGGLVCSMSRSGNVWDNAAMESFFSSLKTERTGNKTYRTRDEAKADVFDYIERFYNAKRRHSTIGYLSPMEFERRAGFA